MPTKAMGVKTNRDALLVDFDQSVLAERIAQLASYTISDNEIKRRFDLEDGRYWNTARERQKIRDVNWKNNIVPFLYRPFDTRWLMYQQNLIEIGRGGASTSVMRHFLAGKNLGLVFMRQVALQDIYTLVFPNPSVNWG
jgi:hypothetical protein